MRRWWWIALGAALVLALVGVGLSRQRQATTAGSPAAARIVSLSPALTETLFAIGAGDQVVGVSDYCNYPPAAKNRIRAGSSITPRYETIVSLAPTVIVTEDVVNARPERLERLAPTLELPWLSLKSVVSGTRKLGALTGRVAAADALADRLWARLHREPPPKAPRVLLVLGYGGDKLDDVWFIRRNSIHGAALAAAGGQNAVARDVDGQPRLSLEQVVALDPDVVIILLSGEQASVERVEAQWKRLEPLSAVRGGRVSAIVAPEAFANGPRILELSSKIEARLKVLSAS
jgi:iron complex transport system substrate-binding protein